MTTTIIALTTVALVVALIAEFLSHKSTQSQPQAIPIPVKERQPF
jgi:hypothetical protein